MSSAIAKLVGLLPEFSFLDVLKAFGALYILVNAKIWPLAWHVRMSKTLSSRV